MCKLFKYIFLCEEIKMHKKRCPKCGLSDTKKMEKGKKNRDINVIIADTFLRIIAEKLQA